MRQPAADEVSCGELGVFAATQIKSANCCKIACSIYQPTMADFAFSAVSAFFGEDPDASPDKKKDETPKHSSVVKAGGRKQARLGLGATEETRTNHQQSQIGKASGAKDIGRKILSVGKSKRGRARDEDDDDGATGDHDDRNDDDEADEEEGRTSAVKSRAPKRTFDAAAAVMSEQPAKKKKKKKAGKKERAAAAAAAAADVETGAEDTGIEGAQEDNGNEDVDIDNAANTQSKTKRKRKKVRSRQKNIRKDNRPARDKPSHLVLGTGNYGGRALTPETRKAMNLPESRTKQRAKRLLKEGGGPGGDGNADIHEDHHSGSGIGSGGDVGLGLAVDDMLDDLGVAAGTDGGQQEQGSNKEKKGAKKKKKKSKFKNLR